MTRFEFRRRLGIAFVLLTVDFLLTYVAFFR